MKPLVFVLTVFLSVSVPAQTIQLENLTNDKIDSRNIFLGGNFFRITSKEPIIGLEYDKTLIDVQLIRDSLTINPIYKVHLADRTSNWDGRNSELTISFITATSKEDIKFYLKKLPHAFPAIMAQPENSRVDKEALITSKKIEIITATPDLENFFSNYKVQKFELVVNNKTYKVAGNELDEKAVTAITLTHSGDKIILQQVETINDRTSRKVTFIGPTVYELK